MAELSSENALTDMDAQYACESVRVGSLIANWAGYGICCVDTVGL